MDTRKVLPRDSFIYKLPARLKQTPVLFIVLTICILLLVGLALFKTGGDLQDVDPSGGTTSTSSTVPMQGTVPPVPIEAPGTSQTASTVPSRGTVVIPPAQTQPPVVIVVPAQESPATTPTATQPPVTTAPTTTTTPPTTTTGLVCTLLPILC